MDGVHGDQKRIYEAADVAAAYQLGYGHGSARQMPFTNEQAVRGVDLMRPVKTDAEDLGYGKGGL